MHIISLSLSIYIYIYTYIRQELFGMKRVLDPSRRLRSTESGAGEQSLPPDCRAETHLKGMFLFTDTSMKVHMGICLYHFANYDFRRKP